MWSKANFVGGHPMIDFVNTVADRGKSREATTLESPRDLVSWIEASGLRAKVLVDPVPSQMIFEEIIDFRETAYRALLSILGRSADPSTDVQRIEYCLKSAIQRASFDMVASPTVWRAHQQSDFYHFDVFALLLDDFLRSVDVGLLRQCERCTWIFLNSGRGRGRKWCNMATCGNRHKVELHRVRSLDLSP